MEGELDNEHIIFEQIIVKDKKNELFALPGMKSCKLSTKTMKGIIPKVEEKLNNEDINLKKYKQLSDSTFHIYEDAYKCSDDSEKKTFYIHMVIKKNILFSFQFQIQTLKCMTKMDIYILKIIFY